MRPALQWSARAASRPGPASHRTGHRLGQRSQPVVGLGCHLSGDPGARSLLVPVQPDRSLEPQKHRLAHRHAVVQCLGADALGSRADQRRLAGSTGHDLAQVAQRPRRPDALALDRRPTFKKLGIEQLFSRPRTPNDNPFIESHFATIKTQPVFPGYFADPAEAEELLSPILSVVQRRASAHAAPDAHAQSGSLRARPTVVGRASGAERCDPRRTRCASPAHTLSPWRSLSPITYPMCQTILATRGRDRTPR